MNKQPSTLTPADSAYKLKEYGKEKPKSVLELTENEKKTVLKLIHRLDIWFTIETVVLILLAIAVVLLLFSAIVGLAS